MRRAGRAGVPAGSSVFLDDRPENVEGAARLGIHAVRFTSAAQAAWLARAAGRGSKIYWTDSDPKNLTRAKAFLRRAGVAGRVEMQLGDALVSFQRTPGTFDMIFFRNSP